MAHIWSFLQDENNRALLAWIGSGVVVIVGGIWAVVKFVASRRAGNSAPSPTVTASHGGVAVGRDIRGSKIETGRQEKR